MKICVGLLISFAACVGQASSFGSLELQFTPWTAICSPATEGQPLKCKVPQSLGPPGPLHTVALAEAANPGEAASTGEDFSFAELSGRLTVFSIYPSDTEIPRYLQIRIELITPVRAVCMTSQRLDVAALVPLICVGYNEPKQYGITMTGNMLTEETSR